jgi:NitT/TauT family transport system permease protein
MRKRRGAPAGEPAPPARRWWRLWRSGEEDDGGPAADAETASADPETADDPVSGHQRRATAPWPPSVRADEDAPPSTAAEDEETAAPSSQTATAPPSGATGAPSEAAAGAAARSATHLAWLRIREEIPAWMAWVLGSLPVLALLGLWWAVTAGPTPESRLMSPTILPSPLEVAGSFRALWFERALTRNLLVSFTRVVSGFGVAVAIAFPLGLGMGGFTKVKAMFNPLAVFGAYLPIPALVPLTLSLFGTGEEQKVAFLAMAFVIYLLPLVVAAVDQVDQVYLKTAYTLGANRWQAVTRVLLGVAWPDIFQAMRMGFGIGWSYIILAEMVDIGRGLGGIIIISQRRGPREHIYLVLLVIVAVAYLTDRLWAWAGARLFPYRVETRR